MRVIKNQPVIQKLSDTMTKQEMSNVAMVLDSPTVITNWFLINPDKTTTVDGWRNIDRYIGDEIGRAHV